MIRLRDAGLRVMMAHSLVKLPRDYAFIAHRLFIIQLSKSAGFDTFRNKWIKAHEGFRFLPFVFPIFAGLQSQRLKNTRNKNGRAVAGADNDFCFGANKQSVF